MSIHDNIEYEKPKSKLIWEYLEKEVKSSDRNTQLVLNYRGLSISTEFNGVQLGFDVTIVELLNYCIDCYHEDLADNVDKYIVSRMYDEYNKSRIKE